jgi:hypothetical protein
MTSTASLLTANIWSHITAGVKRRPARCQVAVAYFGVGASKLLPLKKGSTLVVDMSERAVRSGQTKPSELLSLIRRGVNVHSVRNLHAKLFVMDNTAIIGSTNASRTSALSLIEAAILSRDRRAVSECREFVRSLTGEVVSSKLARAMQKLYSPPKFAPPSPLKKAKRRVPLHSPLWVAPLYQDATPRDLEEVRKGEPQAKSRLRSPRSSRLDFFIWPGKFSARSWARVGDRVLRVVKDGRRLMAGRAAPVVDIRLYRGAAAYFLEAAKGSRDRRLTPLVARIGPRARFLATGQSIRSMRSLHMRCYTRGNE